MVRYSSILILTILVGAFPLTAKQKERDWQQGKLISTDEARYFAGTTGSANTRGTVSDSGDSGTYSGTTDADSTAIYRTYQTYVIESDSYIYVARERSRKPAALTVNGPVRFAIEKDHVFILDENGKVHQALLKKKTLKEKK
jgi:hypothetical protein